MEYNSQKELLVMPEYGRNVQMMVNYAKNIEDKEHRQAFCERLIDLMYQMNPQNKNVEDYRVKLWRHIFHIANYDLDVETPFGEVPTPEDSRKKPDIVDYPHNDTRFRHYGNNVQKLIEKALSMEDGPIKDGFINVIGSYMKLAYKTWLREHYVSDDLIKEDLSLLSGGKLSVEKTISLDTLANPQRRRNKRVSSAPSNAPSERRHNNKYRKNRKR